MRLVVTADDFGVNKHRDEGILHLLQLGAVTHVSLLVNGETSRDAASTFKKVFPSIAGDQISSDGKTIVAPSASRGILQEHGDRLLPAFRTVYFQEAQSSSWLPPTASYITLRHGDPTMGLHFNITEGVPLSAKMKECATLVYFDDRLNSYRNLSKERHTILSPWMRLQ